MTCDLTSNYFKCDWTMNRTVGGKSDSTLSYFHTPADKIISAFLPPWLKRSMHLCTSCEEFYKAGWDIQHWSGHSFSYKKSEDCLFCKLFGCGAVTVIRLWTLLIEHRCLSDFEQICHLLWSLFLNSTWPKQSCVQQQGGGQRETQKYTQNSWSPS